MFCQNCGNKNLKKAEFCNKCGKKLDIEKPKEEIKMSKEEVEKINKNLKNTGNSVVAIGWLTIIINSALFLWSYFSSNEIPTTDFTGILLVMVFSSIFIILGNRIKNLVDKNIKRYIQILIVLSALYLILILYTGGKVGFLYILVIGYLISSFFSIRKAMKVREFTAKLTSLKYKMDKKGWILFIIVAIILFFITVSIDLSDWSVNNYLKRAASNPSSKTKIINDMVRQVKTGTVFPSQIDEITKLVDVTAESNAIRYHYAITDTDTSKLTNETIKSNLIQDLCDNKETRKILDSEINMEYSYNVEGSSQEYFVSITQSDCL